MTTHTPATPGRRASDDPKVVDAAVRVSKALGAEIRVTNVMELRYLTSGVRAILEYLDAGRLVLFDDLAREFLVDQAFRSRRKAQVKINLSEVLSDLNLLQLVVRERSWHVHKTWTQAEKDTIRAAMVQPAVVEKLRMLAASDTEEKVTRSLKEMPDEVSRPIVQAAFPTIAAERTVTLAEDWVEPDPLTCARIELPDSSYVVRFSHRREPKGEGRLLCIHLISFETSEIFASSREIVGVPITFDLPSYNYALQSAAEFFFKTWAENRAPVEAVRQSPIFENTGRFVDMPHVNRRVEIWRIREPYWGYAGIVDRNASLTDQMLLSEAMGRMVNLQATTFDDGAGGPPGNPGGFPTLDFSTASHETIVLQPLPQEDLDLVPKSPVLEKAEAEAKVS